VADRQRADGVAITDISSVSECDPLGPGSQVNMLPPIGSAASTIQMWLNVERPSEPPILSDPRITRQSSENPPPNFFSEGSYIELEKGEQDYVHINLKAETQRCEVRLVMTVKESEQSAPRQQPLLEDGTHIVVAELDPDVKPERFFRAGLACAGFHEAAPELVGTPMESECTVMDPEDHPAAGGATRADRGTEGRSAFRSNA
jgi:hypothetical protein